MSIVRAVCLCFASNLIASAPPGSLERRRAVEEGLTPPIVVKGRASAPAKAMASCL